MLRRLVQLYTGLVFYGISIAVFYRANLGLDPWDVFHMGLAQLTGLKLGQTVILVGALVLLLWWPMRQKPGLGTISNVVVLGLVADAVLAVFPPVTDLWVRSLCLVAAIVLNALATSLYIGAGFGAGPRDGLMTGMHNRMGWPIRRIRTAIELTVLLVGFLMGGSLGIGTVLYAVSIGPLIQLTLPWFATRRHEKHMAESSQKSQGNTLSDLKSPL
ncbi:hypothetical protein A9B99_11330 [Mangrovibacter phragmitis]|uniref:Membrane protein YczE n=1 Tax=Mangrovibacter phragmitis TaxID=1691903 RepID=A0A1B7L144_9ENTR|nr:hypothetical protein [Mangrovibacter phragmitis]OAT76036.1 hypothetical protein A9B99_11330 [Mangrovibacter phragmitis]